MKKFATRDQLLPQNKVSTSGSIDAKYPRSVFVFQNSYLQRNQLFPKAMTERVNIEQFPGPFKIGVSQQVFSFMKFREEFIFRFLQFVNTLNRFLLLKMRNLKIRKAEILEKLTSI